LTVDGDEKLVHFGGDNGTTWRINEIKATVIL